MPPVPSAVSKSNTFITAFIETEYPTVNKQISILVNCTEPMKYINYEVLGRGDVLLANSIAVDGKTVRFYLSINVTKNIICLSGTSLSIHSNTRHGANSAFAC